MKIRSTAFIKSGTRAEHYPPPELPEIAFAGRSNVGKSSLLNCLLNRRNLVKVSGTPGRTQLLNWFNVNDELVVCDLPGYGFAKVPNSVRGNWGRMIGEYLRDREALLALVIIVDVRRGFQDDDLSLIDTARELQLQPILVATKCDKLKRNALMNQQAKISKKHGFDTKRDVIWFSASSGAGREQLWRRIRGLLPVVDG